MNFKFSIGTQLLASTVLMSTIVGTTIPINAQELLIDDIAPDQGNLSEEGFAISADGGTAVGRNLTNPDSVQNILWTQDGGFEPLTVDGVIQGLSGNGMVMTGFVTGANGRDSAFRRTEADGSEILPYLSGDGTGFIDSAVAYDISDDGNTIVGFSNAGESFNFNVHAVKWTNSGIESLGTLEPASNTGIGSVAYGISGDGSTIVGSSGEDGLLGMTAFRHTDANGMVSLGRLNNGNGSEAFAASFDGSVVVGQAMDGASFNASRAFRWTQAGGLEALKAANLSYTASRANDVSADGSVIVGILGTGETTGPRAFRWTAATDAVTVENWLRSAGATIASDTTREAHGISADGTVVVGETRDGQMFIARAVGGAADPYPDPDPDPDPTPGIITVDDMNNSLVAASAANSATLAGVGLIVNGAGSRPLDRKVSEGKSVFWVGGDLARDNHGTRDGRLGLGEIGIGRNFGPVQLNGTVGYNVAGNDTFLGGSTDLATGYIKLETLSQLYQSIHGGLWLVLGGIGLSGNADIARNYLDNGGMIDTSTGSTSVNGFGVRARLQWEKVTDRISVAPFSEVTHARACLDAYSETGGAFPASFNKLCDETTEARIGVDATVPVTENFRFTGTFEGIHRFQDQGSNISGQVIGLGGFETQQMQNHQNWLRGGVGFEVDVGGSTFALMANATTKGENSDAWLAANWKKEF